MGGSQSATQSQQAQAGYSPGYQQQQASSQMQEEDPNYFPVLIDDLYQRMKARAAADPQNMAAQNIGWSDSYQDSSDTGFSF